MRAPNLKAHHWSHLVLKHLHQILRLPAQPQRIWSVSITSYTDSHTMEPLSADSYPNSRGFADQSIELSPSTPPPTSSTFPTSPFLSLAGGVLRPSCSLARRAPVKLGRTAERSYIKIWEGESLRLFLQFGEISPKIRNGRLCFSNTKGHRRACLICCWPLGLWLVWRVRGLLDHKEAASRTRVGAFRWFIEVCWVCWNLCANLPSQKWCRYRWGRAVPTN